MGEDGIDPQESVAVAMVGEEFTAAETCEVEDHSSDDGESDEPISDAGDQDSALDSDTESDASWEYPTASHPGID